MDDLRCTATGDWGRCERPISGVKSRLCYGHVRQVRDRGKVYRAVGPQGPKPRPGCDFPGCGRPHDSKGYCTGHYNQIRKGHPLRSLPGRNPPGTKCSASGEGWRCDQDARPFSERCQFHIEQLSRLGEVRARVRRTSEEVAARDPEGRKQCLRCGEWKDGQGFYEAIHTSDGRQPDCIECYLWRNTMRNFNMTREEYEALLESQGGVCAVCSDAPGWRRLSVDHDHSCCPDSGKSCGKCVRGILCGKCNSALGNADDDVERLRALIAYLESWKHD